MSIEEETNIAIKSLEDNIFQLSKLFRECYLEHGRGAFILYADTLKKGILPFAEQYNTKEDAVDLFDDANSRVSLSNIIEKYNQKSEGVIVLITSSNAARFITIKLGSRTKNNGSTS